MSPLIQALIQALIHSVIRSFVRSFFCSFIRSSVHSITAVAECDAFPGCLRHQLLVVLRQGAADTFSVVSESNRLQEAIGSYRYLTLPQDTC